MSYPLPPGVNFGPRQRVRADVLCAALAQTASFLQHPDPGARLHLFHDWLQHDGLMFDKGPTTFHDLFRVIDTPRSLLAAMPGDHQVRLGFAPAPDSSQPRWYLRFILDWDAGDTHLVGEFDLTLPPPLAEVYRREVASALPFDVAVEDAAGYYRRITESE